MSFIESLSGWTGFMWRSGVGRKDPITLMEEFSVLERGKHKTVAPADWSDEKKEVVAALGDRLDDPAMVDNRGRVIVDVSQPFEQTLDPTKHKTMSNEQKAAYKQYMLERTMLKIQRRDDHVAQHLNFNGDSVVRQSYSFGTPFPVIEPHPHIAECWYGIRWYEHGIVLGAAYLFNLSFRHRGLMAKQSKHAALTVIVCGEFLVTHYNSKKRLAGLAPNERECYKYGVLESNERLREKAAHWRAYKEYKDEWCRRYDYFVYGQRPGERLSLLASCHWRPRPVIFNEKFDYPMRKNPYWTYGPPLETARLEGGRFFQFVPGAETALEVARPELKYIYERNVRGGIAT